MKRESAGQNWSFVGFFRKAQDMKRSSAHGKSKYCKLISGIIILGFFTAVAMVTGLSLASPGEIVTNPVPRRETATPNQIAEVSDKKVELTAAEQAYLDALGPVKICIDPDWEPYERINEQGVAEGIAVDLVALIASRTGVELELVATSDWEESLKNSRMGKCQVLGLLLQTPYRDQWLVFTEPYFSDPSVLITRAEHDYISDLASLSGETLVLPEGTGTEEAIRRDYPNLEIMTVESEAVAFEMVETRQADLTIRSLTMAAFTIKSQGFFNLKIAGQVPNYTYAFRMGVVEDEPMLRDILNKGIATLSPQEIQKISNEHIAVEMQSAIDYDLLWRVVLIFVVVAFVGLLWLRQLQNFNKKLTQKTKELEQVTEELSADIIAREKAEAEIRILLYHDQLTGLYNRTFLNQMVLVSAEAHPITVFMFDLDGLKEVNDTHGHLQGDILIKNAANLFTQCFIENASIIRIGGDEFLAVVTNCNEQRADDLRDCIRQAVTAYNLQNQDASLVISLSMGYAISKNPATTMAEFMQKSDEQMYADKLRHKKGIYDTAAKGIWIE